MAFMREHALRVTPNILPAETVRDPKDVAILACAVAGDAEVVVTGDLDLLSLGTFRGVRIVSPRQFVEEELE